MKKDFTFDTSMSREVLNNYLSRAVTHFGIGYVASSSTDTFEDDLRMFKNEGTKFIGRAAWVFSNGVPDSESFEFTKKRLARGHEVDPEFIFQACVFECICRPFVNQTPVPAYVFEAFGMPAEDRCFSFDLMKFEDQEEGAWGSPETATPDITRLEAQMWFFYRSAEYIKTGCEAIHMGQVCLIGRDDDGFVCWKSVIDKVRAFAAVHTRRHCVLIDGHTYGRARRDDTMFDFNSYPIRLKEIIDRPIECICEEGYLDSIFNPEDGLAKPFLVEFDHWGVSDFPGVPRHDTHFAWGYDEITWFSKCSPEYREYFLNYIADWVKERYPDGWVQMPSRRSILSERRVYCANTRSEECPCGWSDEETIKAIFART